jgi:protein gp37
MGCGADGVKRNKKSNGRLLLGKEWNEKPLLAVG